MKAFKANINTILVTVIGSVLLMIITGVVGFVKMQRINTIKIETIEQSKVDQEKFNRFLKTFAEHTVLTETLISLNSKEVDQLNIRQREIELVKLQQIERNIAILDQKIQILLSDYETIEIKGDMTDSIAKRLIIYAKKLEDYDIQRTIKGLNQ